MPTVTFEYRSQQERLAIERAVAFVHDVGVRGKGFEAGGRRQRPEVVGAAFPEKFRLREQIARSFSVLHERRVCRPHPHSPRLMFQTGRHSTGYWCETLRRMSIQ